MQSSTLLLATFLTSAILSAQPAKGFAPGTYSFLPRTASYDPQFDTWRIQVVADSFRVFDPGGALFLVSVTKMMGDTVHWTDISGPCTGVVSRYKVARDSIGITVDLIDDACTDRAAAIVHMYFTPVKGSGNDEQWGQTPLLAGKQWSLTPLLAF